MNAAAHSIGKLDLRATVGDLDKALALRPRIEALATELAPAVIERVCEAAVPGAAYLRIARLDLDLGTIGEEHFEQETLAALERALSEAIGRALHDAKYAPSEDAALIPEPQAALECFKEYLLSGIVRWRDDGAAFDPTAELRALIADQPAALAAMLRRIGGRRHALERLVVQAGAALPALLAVLAPADAAAILALIGDIVVAHRADPEPPLDALPEPALERMLWVTTLEFLLRDAGSEFNRRRFLGFLLGREAERVGVDYIVLLRTLADAAEQMSLRQGFRSSLPALLVELADELPVSARDRAVLTPSEREAAALQAAKAGRLDPLADLLRSYAEAGDRRLAELLGLLDDAMLRALIRRIAPADASAISELVDAFASCERAALPAGSASHAARRLLGAAIAYRLSATGRGVFDWARLVRHLLRVEAARIGMSDAALLTALTRASHAQRDSDPTGLTSIFRALADAGDGLWSDTEGARLDPARLLEWARARIDDRGAFAAWVDALDEPAFRGALRQAGAAGVAADVVRLVGLHRHRPFDLLSEAAMRRFARRAILAATIGAQGGNPGGGVWWRRVIASLALEIGVGEGVLRERVAIMLDERGTAVSDMLRVELGQEIAKLDRRTAPEPKPATLATDLRGAPPEAARAILSDAAREPAALLAIAAALSARERAGHIRAIQPTHADAVMAQIAIFARLHATVPLITIGQARFAQLLWALAVTFLTRSGNARFDAAALARHFVAGIGAYDGVAERRVAQRIDEGLRKARDTRTGDKGPARSRAIDGVESLLARVAEEIAEPVSMVAAEARHRRIAHYLRTGQPVEAGAGLPGLVADDPAWLAAEVRRLARATPAMVPLLLDRLRTWLLPGEVIAMLMPGDRARAARLADALETGGEVAWSRAFTRLLRGELPSVPRRRAPIGPRFDEAALIAHWLDHGAAPWWAHDRSAPRAVLARLTAMPYAALEELFTRGGVPGAALTRLRRAIGWLDADTASALLARLAPRATGGEDALRALLAPLDARQRLTILLRAAAAALEGAVFDPQSDAEPLADLPPSSMPAHQTPPPPGREPSLDRLLAWLGGTPASTNESAALVRLFARLLDARDKRLAAYLAGARRNAQTRNRWVALLPEEALARLVHAILPARDAHALLEAKQVLASAWRRTAPFGAARIDPAAWWTMLLDLAAEPGIDFTAAIDRMVARLSARDDARAVALRGHALTLADSGGHRSVAAALRRPEARRIVPLRDEPAKPATKEPSRAKQDEPADLPREDEPIYVANAGLVLLGPYLPPLFDRLGVLTQGEGDDPPRIVGIEDASRAVHLLQYLVDTRLDAAEPDLALNKLLCGLPVEQPVLPCLDAAPEDLAICDGLLGAVIANWPIVKGTSLDGLRETFLQREGRLRRGDSGWELVVQRKGVDVLVDQIPWGFAMIYHRWMPEPVQVTW